MHAPSEARWVSRDVIQNPAGDSPCLVANRRLRRSEWREAWRSGAAEQRNGAASFGEPALRRLFGVSGR